MGLKMPGSMIKLMPYMKDPELRKAQNRLGEIMRKKEIRNGIVAIKALSNKIARETFMFSNTVKIMVLVLAICACGAAAQADEVLDAINEAIEAYNEKIYTEAVESLEYAKQLIQQMTSERLMTFLPEPMEGWQGKIAEPGHDRRFISYREGILEARQRKRRPKAHHVEYYGRFSDFPGNDGDV